MTTTAIDAWAQPALGRTRADMPEVVRLFEKSGTAHLLDVRLSPEETVAQMDAAGVEKLMLAAWCRPGRWIITNDEVADFVRAFPDRFCGVATVDLADPVAAVRELDRAVNQLGFKALRNVPWLWKLPPNHRLYYPLYVKCIELGIPFCTQVGHTGPLMPSETGRPVPYLDEVALDFPALRIVAGHIGHPWTDEMIGLAWKHDNVYIDTSAYLPRYYPPQLLQFLKTYGQDKVLFGSNFPQLALDRCLTQVRELGLPAEIEAKFLRGNAERVFRLTGAPASAGVVPHVEHVALWTNDIARCCEFYRRYFGAVAGPAYTNAAKGFESRFLTLGNGARVEVMRTTMLSPVAIESGAQRMGLTHIAVSVGSESAVGEITATLQRDGYPVLDGPRRTGDGYYESVVLDPDGNRIEITA